MCTIKPCTCIPDSVFIRFAKAEVDEDDLNAILFLPLEDVLADEVRGKGGSELRGRKESRSTLIAEEPMLTA